MSTVCCSVNPLFARRRALGSKKPLYMGDWECRPSAKAFWEIGGRAVLENAGPGLAHPARCESPDALQSAVFSIRHAS